MALMQVVPQAPAADDYVLRLRDSLLKTSPLLVDRDIWGFATLRDGFGIGPDSPAYHNKVKFLGKRRIAQIETGKLDQDAFLRNGVGLDLSGIPEPHKTETKSVFCMWLNDPRFHSYHLMIRYMALAPFITKLCQSDTVKPMLAAYTEEQLEALFTAWKADEGLHIPDLKDRTFVGKRFIRTLSVIRGRHLPMAERDFVLAVDMFPNQPSKGSGIWSAQAGMNFGTITLPFLREATRAFVADRVKYGHYKSHDTVMNIVDKMVYFEKFLLEQVPNPTLADITKERFEDGFRLWRPGARATPDWFVTTGTILNWASANLPGWPPLGIRANGNMIPGLLSSRKRANDREFDGRMMPEAIVEQIFAAIEAGEMPQLLKHLFIIARYTGMRRVDFHRLAFDCLRADPNDDRFMLLSFFQSKAQTWNTKPLKVDDPAHKLLIKTIRDQQNIACETVSRLGDKTPQYLFPTVRGSVEGPNGHYATGDNFKAWTIERKFTNPDGSAYVFSGWHSIRHYHGTEMALAGHEMHFIMLELGHSSPEMTMRYMNRRMDLKKQALLEKGGGRFIDIQGNTDDKMGELALRKDALTVDVPGGLCAMPGTIGEWCEHNRACFTCTNFRADIDQLAFFEREKASVGATITRLKKEIDGFAVQGKARMAEIGKARLTRTEQVLGNLTTITTTIKTEGSYRGTERKAQGSRGCGSGSECGS